MRIFVLKGKTNLKKIKKHFYSAAHTCSRTVSDIQRLCSTKFPEIGFSGTICHYSISNIVQETLFFNFSATITEIRYNTKNPIYSMFSALYPFAGNDPESFPLFFFLFSSYYFSLYCVIIITSFIILVNSLFVNSYIINILLLRIYIFLLYFS